jgi:hypothetical protein
VPAQSIAWTLQVCKLFVTILNVFYLFFHQNYGAYIVDDTYYNDIMTLCGELGPNGGVVAEFEKAYGYTTYGTGPNSSWVTDINKYELSFFLYAKKQTNIYKNRIFASLAAVDNWNFDLIQYVQASNGALGAGGGAPLQPWAPPLPGMFFFFFFFLTISFSLFLCNAQVRHLLALQQDLLLSLLCFKTELRLTNGA